MQPDDTAAADDGPHPRRRCGIERALRRAAPHAVVEAVTHELLTRFGATGCRLLLADYRQTAFLPAGFPDDAPIPLDGTVAGRCFASQDPMASPWKAGPDPGRTVHVPVTARGDRLGVLEVRFGGHDGGHDGELGAGDLADLHDAASALAHALVVAERDTDLYAQARRRRRLTIAAEMQWDLLPGRGSARDEYVLAGQLEPAYSIGGDNFDWAGDASQLTLSVTNGMGHGFKASLLTSLTVSALRNARRSGSDLADQARLADEPVHSQYGGTQYVATLLLRFDLATGRVTAVDAGSPLILRARGPHVLRVGLEPQLPLGMFGNTEYDEQPFDLEPGDRLVIVSDGVYGSLGTGNRAYGDRALDSTIRASRLQPPGEVVRTILRDLVTHHGDVGLDDDAVVVCLDWTGKRC